MNKPKITPETLTDEMIVGCIGISEEVRECAIAVDPNWPGGSQIWGWRYRDARRRVCDAINARNGAK